MTTAHFYQHFDRNIPSIQSLASSLANDLDIARFLYQETAHQAIKNKNNLEQDALEEWLMQTVKKTYYKMIQKKFSTSRRR